MVGGCLGNGGARSASVTGSSVSSKSSGLIGSAARRRRKARTRMRVAHLGEQKRWCGARGRKACWHAGQTVGSLMGAERLSQRWG
jgi:hypothetical protein